MGVTELLTLVFIGLKVTGRVAWTWPMVLVPELIAAAFYVEIGLLWVVWRGGRRIAFPLPPDRTTREREP